ncbi:hypothetical protein COY27_04985 [Candidatus Woesearchaeota archaeon CG_4_10_14_0_2_um_filter_33_13]|nr:MAG: hypothetical protein COY27_04985 [Candidatus Woesearchaeota archaeon CG_4_10_14_0_2_um_filter_33_13]
MKHAIILLVILSIFAVSVIATGDLVVELLEPQHMPRTGFEEEYFLPFKVTNIGDEAVSSRFPIKMLESEGRNGTGYPLYIYSGDMLEEGTTPLKKAPIEKKDGTVYWQDVGSVEIPLGNGVIPAAPAITLQPGESLLFTDYELIGGMSSFYFNKAGEFEIGYEVDPVDDTNEIAEKNDNNNKATTKLNVTLYNYVKGPNPELGLNDNQYWFYFNEVGDCLTLDLPEATKICLVGGGSFGGAFSTIISVDGKEVKLFHLWEVFGFSKSYQNMDFIAGDGFIVTYS